MTDSIHTIDEVELRKKEELRKLVDSNIKARLKRTLTLRLDAADAAAIDALRPMLTETTAASKLIMLAVRRYPAAEQELLQSAARIRELEAAIDGLVMADDDWKLARDDRRDALRACMALSRHADPESRKLADGAFGSGRRRAMC